MLFYFFFIDSDYCLSGQQAVGDYPDVQFPVGLVGEEIFTLEPNPCTLNQTDDDTKDGEGNSHKIAKALILFWQGREVRGGDDVDREVRGGDVDREGREGGWE